MDYRTAIFKCKSCSEPYINDTADEEYQNRALCSYCLFHPEPELQQENYTIPLLEDLGLLRTSKNQRAHFGRFECKHCNLPFVRKAIKVQHQKELTCDKCKAETRKAGISRIVKIWSSMKARTSTINKPGTANYLCYVEKGITICDEWKNNSAAFEEWALDNGYDDTLSIDRINNDGNYEPNNCRWTNHYVQSANTRRLRSTNTSGYRNVTWYKPKQKWRVQISIQNQRKTLGYFDNKIEAALYHDKYIDDNNLPHTKNF